MVENSADRMSGRDLMTALCGRLGLDVPIVQAPIGNVCTLELAAAVASAGVLPVGGYEPREISAVLARLADMTSRSVGLTLNIRRDQTDRPSSLP
jgi:NAD(P)H-dependent flavin oxidoreductase YrpB (nitropropane dioxygenase family)